MYVHLRVCVSVSVSVSAFASLRKEIKKFHGFNSESLLFSVLERKKESDTASVVR